MEQDGERVDYLFLIAEGMTMVSRWTVLLAGGLAAGLLAAPSAGASDDTVRLGGNIDSKATTLAYDGSADTVLTHGYRGGFGHVHYRGVGWGYYGYHGPRYSYYYRGWIPPVYVSVGPSYYYSAPYYYTPPVYYSPAYSYYPISLQAQVGVAPTLSRPVLQVAPGQQSYSPAGPARIPVMPTPVQPGDGTFKYDGGPASPVPLPGDSSAPINQPRGNPLPADGRYVSLPSKTTTAASSGRLVYPAYGESATSNSATYATMRVPATMVIGSASRNGGRP
jgi:hypothetical protein